VSPSASVTSGKGALQRAQLKALQLQKIHNQYNQHKRSSESLSSFYSNSTRTDTASFTFVPTPSRPSHTRAESAASSSPYIPSTVAVQLCASERERDGKRLSASSAHSNESASSTDSSGRRRKPIPVEIFLR
jgi:hypothetical protein